MKQKEVFKKIGGIIKELNEQYEFLQTETGDLSDLEIEIFVANAHFLADHAEILYKVNLQNRSASAPAEHRETKHEPKYFEPVVQQMRHTPGTTEAKRPPSTRLKPIEAEDEEKSIAEDRSVTDQPVPEIDLTSESSEDTYSFIREEPETIRHELILDDTQNWDEEEYIDDSDETIGLEELEADTIDVGETPIGKTEEDVPTPVVNKFIEEPKNATVADDEIVTINQKISIQLANKTAEQLSVKPIADIKSAITLNDKLLFVKELFNGYNLAYSEAIEILNRFNTFDEAMRFLTTNYITKNNWDSKPETTDKFYALLKRRYA